MDVLLGGLELGPQGSRTSPRPPSPLVTDRRVSVGRSIPSSEHMGQPCLDLKEGEWGEGSWPLSPSLDPERTG